MIALRSDLAIHVANRRISLKMVTIKVAMPSFDVKTVVAAVCLNQK